MCRAEDAPPLVPPSDIIQNLWNAAEKIRSGQKGMLQTYSRHTSLKCSFKNWFLLCLLVNILYVELGQVVDSPTATAKKDYQQSALKWATESERGCQTEKEAVRREAGGYFIYVLHVAHVIDLQLLDNKRASRSASTEPLLSTSDFHSVMVVFVRLCQRWHAPFVVIKLLGVKVSTSF